MENGETREPIWCPVCQQGPVKTPGEFAGRYQCEEGHVFHRCLHHRMGSEGPSPFEGRPQNARTQAELQCTCRFGVSQFMQGYLCGNCDSILVEHEATQRLAPGRAEYQRYLEQGQILRGRCLSCLSQLEFCQIHRCWGRFPLGKVPSGSDQTDRRCPCQPQAHGPKINRFDPNYQRSSSSSPSTSSPLPSSNSPSFFSQPFR